MTARPSRSSNVCSTWRRWRSSQAELFGQGDRADVVSVCSDGTPTARVLGAGTLSKNLISRRTDLAPSRAPLCSTVQCERATTQGSEVWEERRPLQGGMQAGLAVKC